MSDDNTVSELQASREIIGKLTTRCENLAAANERLRVALGHVRDRMKDAHHMLMMDGQSVHDYCRKAIIGPETPVERQKTEDLLS